MYIATTRLYGLFNSLSERELKEFSKAVVSPFFNYREEEMRLFDYLRKAKKRRAPALVEEKILKYVFPGQKAGLAQLRHVMTYLTRLITRYIAIHEMEQNTGVRQLLVVQSLRRREAGLPAAKAGKLFMVSYDNAKRYLDNEAPLSPGLYYHQMQLNSEYYDFSIANKRAPGDDWKVLGSQLDLFYATRKLKQACNALSYKNIFVDEEPPEMMEETLKLIERKELLGNPLVSLLYYNYLCLAEPENEEHFIRLKQILLQGPERIDTGELRDIFILAVNYCIKRLNTGGQKYYRHVFDIYEAGLKRLVFEEGGKLSPFTYKNISAIALGLKKYAWAFSFIENYKNRLDSGVRDGFYAYCLARYYFAKENYNRVGNLLREVEIKEQFTGLDARVLLVKTYYESDEGDLLHYAIGNLKQQLKRKKLQTYHEEVYKNFANMVGRLVHLRPYDKKAKEAFKQKLSAMQAVAEKEWLLGKI